MSEWLTWLESIADGEQRALVSVLATEGSAPRGPGTRMLVTAQSQSGTIGGGQLEFRALEQARAILDLPPGAWRIQDYPLGPLLGQCCGGRVRLLVEHVDAADLGWLRELKKHSVLVTQFTPDRVVRFADGSIVPTALSARGDRPRAGERIAEFVGQLRRPVRLFGAGHVGQAIFRHAASLPFDLAWFDTRPVFEAIEAVTIVPDDTIEQCIVEAPEDSAILILTHDHSLDYRLTRAALERSPVAFVGLIGSATKRARFLSRLRSDGLGDDALARLTSPIGVEGVQGKEPDVIAIATLAQLLRLRDQ